MKVSRGCRRSVCGYVQGCCKLVQGCCGHIYKCVHDCCKWCPWTYPGLSQMCQWMYLWTCPRLQRMCPRLSHLRIAPLYPFTLVSIHPRVLLSLYPPALEVFTIVSMGMMDMRVQSAQGMDVRAQDMSGTLVPSCPCIHVLHLSPFELISWGPSLLPMCCDLSPLCPCHPCLLSFQHCTHVLCHGHV